MVELNEESLHEWKMWRDHIVERVNTLIEVLEKGDYVAAEAHVDGLDGALDMDHRKKRIMGLVDSDE